MLCWRLGAASYSGCLWSLQVAPFASITWMRVCSCVRVSWVSAEPARGSRVNLNSNCLLLQSSL